jgi:hypothetical protein
MRASQALLVTDPTGLRVPDRLALTVLAAEGTQCHCRWDA